MSSAAIAACVLIGLAGCSQDSGSNRSAVSPTFKKPAQPAKRGPSVEELTSGMVQAAPQGKSQLPLDVKFDLAEKPVKGQPLEVNLALVPQIAAEQASVQVSGLEGFEAPDSRQFDFSALEVGEVYRHTVKLTPNAEGVLLLGLTVVVNHDDVSDTKEFSIPVIVSH